MPVSLYDTCRAGGAIIATGHDHTYARTYPMADLGDGEIASRSAPSTVGNGTTFAVVSGAAGHGSYDTTDRADAEWWAATHTSGAFGTFFCTLRADGTGECWYETVDEEVVDGPFAVERVRANRTAADGR